MPGMPASEKVVAARTLAAVLAAIAIGCPTFAQASKSPLTRLLEAEISRFPARGGIYVKHLKSGEEAGVRADEAFNTFSVIKLAILTRAYNLADQKKLDLNERVEIRRSDIRDGSGIFQFHDYGLKPTLRDVLTEMVITSDNTATDIMVDKVGGFDKLNQWTAAAGFPKFQMLRHGWEWRQKLMVIADPRFAGLSAEQIVGLMYAMQSNALFSRYQDLFTGPRAELVEVVRSAAFHRGYNQARDKYLSDDSNYWLGTMTAREVGRLLEAIETNTIASKESCGEMRAILLRQQAGTRRIPHFLNVPVGHKTGDGPPNIANDVGIVYAHSGPIVMSFVTANNTGPYAELEDRMGRVAKMVVDYFDGPSN
jgi:beta-lactamase class A